MSIPAVTAVLAAHGAWKGQAGWIEALVARCHGELSKNGEVTGRHGDDELRLRMLPKKQGVAVSVPCRKAGRFRVTRTGRLDRWMAGFVPAWGFRSCDERFDRDFQVQTRDVEVTAAILAKTLGRRAVRELFDRGVHDLRLHEDRVEALLGPKALGKEPEPEAILDLVAPLARMARAVTGFARRHEVRPAPKVDAAAVLSWTALAVLGVAGLVLLIAGASLYPLIRPAEILSLCAIVGLPAVAPVVFALTLAVQRRTSPYGLVRGLAALTLPVVPLFVSGLLVFVNGALDDSPLKAHVVPIIAKDVRKSDDDLRYYAGLASWWTEDDIYWLRVPKSVHANLEPGTSRLRIQTREGQLGYEWRASWEVVR